MSVCWPHIAMVIQICQHEQKFIAAGQIPNFLKTSAGLYKSSTPSMFGEFAIGQQLLDKVRPI